MLHGAPACLSVPRRSAVTGLSTIWPSDASAELMRSLVAPEDPSTRQTHSPQCTPDERAFGRRDRKLVPQTEMRTPQPPSRPDFPQLGVNEAESPKATPPLLRAASIAGVLPCCAATKSRESRKAQTSKCHRVKSETWFLHLVRLHGDRASLPERLPSTQE